MPNKDIVVKDIKYIAVEMRHMSTLPTRMVMCTNRNLQIMNS